MKILLVDDDKAFAKITKKFLQAFKFQIVEAHNGQEALNAYKNDTFDLIITDMVMPQMDGAQLITEIRLIDRAIPIIVISAYEDKLKNLDVFAALSKPIEYKQLFNKVDEVKNFLEHKPIIQKKIQSLTSVLTNFLVVCA